MKKEMKKNLFMVAAVALMAMISCNKEEINNIGEPQEPQTPEVVAPSYYVEFTADLGAEETVTPTVQQSATRTTIDVANKKTLWVEGDAISVNGKKFVVKELINGGLSARFVNEGELGTDFKAPYTAKYPYKANGTIEIPASQTAVQGGIDPAYVPALAYSDDNSLSFKHAASIIKFQVAVACNQVVLSSDDALAGTLTVTLPEKFDGEPTFSAATKTVTVNGSFVADQDYYLAVLPGKKNNFEVRIDGYLSKNAASVNIARSNIVNMKTLPTPDVDVYILASHLNWTKANILIDGKSAAMTSETVSGRSYFKASVPYKTTANIKFNSGGTTSSYWMVQVGADNEKITIGSDKYYRISPRGPVEINPADESTFGYSIFVFDQKSKNQAPNLYVWEDNNAFKNLYGGNFSSWPGVAFKNDSYYKPANNQNWKHYYYYEIPTALYGKSFKFIVNKSGQTSDLSVTKLAGDLYVGYWYDNASSNGFWTNANLNTPITQ